MGERTPTDHEIRILTAAARDMYDANSTIDIRVCSSMAKAGWLERVEGDGSTRYQTTYAGRALLP